MIFNVEYIRYTYSGKQSCDIVKEYYSTFKNHSINLLYIHPEYTQCLAICIKSNDLFGSFIIFGYDPNDDILKQYRLYNGNWNN